MFKKFISVFSSLLFVIFFLSITHTKIFPSESKDLAVVFLDIGQGDATYIKTPQNKRILIDGGPDKTILYKLGKYIPWWEKEIDAVYISHPHADHILGIIEVLKKYKVKKIYLTRAIIKTSEYEELLESIKMQNTEIEYITSKQDVEYDSSIHFQILHPEKSFGEVTDKDINNTSMLMKLVYGNSSILFTGDLEIMGQKENLAEDIDSDILKVPHQGSSDSMNLDFMKKVSPQYAVIFVGKNNYGHPSQRVIRSYERLGSQVLITQDRGDIVFHLDGENISLK